MDIGGIVRGGLGAAPRGAGVFLRARTTQGEGSDRPASPSPLSCFALTPPAGPPLVPRHQPWCCLGGFFAVSSIPVATGPKSAAN